MKKNNILYALVFCVFGTLVSFVSCKDFLTEEPVTAISESAAFGNVQNARTTVLGVYNRLSGNNGFGQILSMIYPHDSDLIIQFVNANIPDGGRRDISRYFLLQTNAVLAGPFTRLYSGVERANICIKNIPNMAEFTLDNADGIEARRLYGEALTLRAVFFLELVKHWGDVPAPFVPSIDQEDLNLDKTDRDTILDRVLEDLRIAADLVPWRGEVAADERITKGAVKGMRARIALIRGGYALRRQTRVMERRTDYLQYYQIARDECYDIIQSGRHNLNPSFEAVFRNALLARTIEPNGEVVFEVAMAGRNSEFDSQLGAFNGPSVNGRGNRSLFVMPYYFYAFDSLDTRRDVTVAPYTVNASGYKILAAANALTDGKFRRDWMSNPVVGLAEAGSFWSVNWPLLRYSDVLLMFAETENELNQNPTAAAVEAFERVRLRAFGGNAALIGTTPDNYIDFFNAIINERAFELGGEGLRKYDLIRWNKLHEKLLEARQKNTDLRLRRAPYTGFPGQMLYRTNSTELQFYNSLYLPVPTATPAGFTRANWLSPLGDVFIQRLGADFQPNQGEVYPLPQSALETNTTLSQDYGY